MMPFWDFFEDEVLLIGAYCHHYNMTVDDFYNMSIYEFDLLLPEIMSTETAFANVVRLRRETDKDRIKNFDADQKAEWDKYQKRLRIWDKKENERINKWREEHKDQIEAKQREFEEKKKIAAEKLKKMLS